MTTFYTDSENAELKLTMPGRKMVCSEKLLHNPKSVSEDTKAVKLKVQTTGNCCEFEE